MTIPTLQLDFALIPTTRVDPQLDADSDSFTDINIVEGEQVARHPPTLQNDLGLNTTPLLLRSCSSKLTPTSVQSTPLLHRLLDMTMEVSQEQTQMVEYPVKGEEPVKLEEAAVKEKKTEVSDGNDPPSDHSLTIVDRNPFFKEESERRDLFELQIKLEEAIAEGSLLKKDKKETPDQEALDFSNEDFSIWGVPLLPSKGAKSTVVVLLKFLCTRELKVKDDFEMLKNTLRWRKETKVDSILDEEDLRDVFGKVGFINGLDMEGHPVCYNILDVFQDAEMNRMAFGSNVGHKNFLRLRVQLMEQGIKELDIRHGEVSSLLHIPELKDVIGLSKEFRDTIRLCILYKIIFLNSLKEM